jgi:hypothetical protein
MRIERDRAGVFTCPARASVSYWSLVVVTFRIRKQQRAARPDISLLQ